MVQRLETSEQKQDCLVLEMLRTIGHQATRNAVGGALVDDGVSSILRLRIPKAGKLLEVRMVVTHVLFLAVAWPKVDVDELHEIIRLRLADGRNKWAWYLLLSKSR